MFDGVGKAAMLTDAEFERRKPVWTAFSEFWLDTELDESDLARIAGVATAFHYNIAELRDIYLYEVAPVVYLNAWSVAGVWTGFDEEWLRTEARRRAERRSLWLRFWIFIRIGRWFMTHATERHWHRLVTLLSSPANPSSPGQA
jgi:hypothetical protein